MAPTFTPKLVILDINMPAGMDGYETAAELRKQSWSHKATFVAHTASTDPDLTTKVKKAGFGYFVPKPSNATAFEEIVNGMREG